MPGMLSYSLTVCMSLIQSRQFRNKVGNFNNFAIVNIESNLKKLNCHNGLSIHQALVVSRVDYAISTG